jgi:hypothetical protein
MEILQDMSGWTKIKEANGVLGFTRESEGCAHRTFKAEYFLEKPPKVVARYIFENFPELNEEFNSGDLDLVRETEQFGPNMHTHEVAIKPIGPVSGRELDVVGIFLETGEETYVDVGVSIENGRERREGYVTAELVLGVTYYEPVGDDPNRTHVQVVVLVDPKGNIPAMVANAMMGNRTVFYEKLRDKLNNL